ncbi:hypothetical protein OWV82_007716 [Melia azedarach]|uniref:Uncharacterized protein n=1 Tax=Melia azedarach TaxID=155640 RepID=A0ACC1YB50_MELAZ|nr:hypothetical protein OWV82_007716 [Melia azedarach]
MHSDFVESHALISCNILADFSKKTQDIASLTETQASFSPMLLIWTAEIESEIHVPKGSTELGCTERRIEQLLLDKRVYAFGL